MPQEILNFGVFVNSLPARTLTGSELVPVIVSSVTKQVAVADLVTYISTQPLKFPNAAAFTDSSRNIYYGNGSKLADPSGNLYVGAGLYDGTSSLGTSGYVLRSTGTGIAWQPSTVTLFNHFANAGNTTTTETDLYSDTVAAGQLAANGDKLLAEYAGSFVSSGTATRDIRLYFGGSVIFDSGALTLTLSSAWVIYVTIIRVSATVIRYSISMTTEGAALASYTAVGEVTGLTLSGTNVLKITGQAAGVGAGTNNIVASIGVVDYKPAA